MAAEQRKLLQQLMGSDSLDLRQPKRREVDFLDPKICKGFLLGNCISEIFANTKQDSGSCPKIHDEQARLEYRAQVNRGKEFPEIDQEYERQVERYVQDCNRRVEAANQRLEKTPEDIAKINAATKELEDINTRLAWGLQEVELLGGVGEITRAGYELNKLDELWKEQESKEREIRTLSEQGGFAAHQKLQVCQTCGAFLSRLDTDKRLAEHFLGKLHMGYVRIREIYEEINQKKQDARMKREKRSRE